MASRRPSRSKPSAPADPAVEQKTRIKSAAAVRGRGAPREEEEYPAEEESYGDEGTPEAMEPLQEDDDDNPDATRAGPPLTLEIIEGPDEGRRKRFKSVRMVIGRGADCDLTLNDQSVSRRHVELVYGGESGVLMRDLGSGNGTKVNDERSDERKLVHNDVIGLGRTRIRFIDEQERIKQMRAEAEEAERKEKEEAERLAREKEEAEKKAAEAAAAAKEGEAAANPEGGEPAPNGEENKGTQVRDIRDIPRRNPPPSSRMGLMAAGVLVLLIALIGGGVLFIKRGPPPPPPPNPKEERARALMQEARTAFRQGDYAEAVKLVEDAEALFPKVDTENFGEVARKELAIVQDLQQVRALIEAHKFDEAQAMLDAVPHGTAQSTEAQREKLVAELGTQRLAFLVKQVEEALEARDPEKARELIQKLPVDSQVTYLGKVSELEKELAAEAKDAATRDRLLRAAAAKRAQEERAATIAAAFSGVESRFNAGDFPRATLECDRVIDNNAGDKEIRDRAKLLKKLIPQFARFYQDAQRKVQANALESAARPLRSAADLYRQIGFQGPMGETLNGQLASAAVVAGKGALARNDVATAATFFHEALRLRPDDSKALDGMETIQSKLGDLFKQAYIQRDRDPEGSAEKFRLISELASEGSDLKSKAQEQLQALQQ